MNTDRELTGKTVLVTGGSMGIGYACADAALAAGASVVIAARNQASLDEACVTLSEHGRTQTRRGRILAVSCDVSDEAAVTGLFAQIEREFGALHGVVHAAAVQGPIDDVLNVDPTEWLDALRMNLFGSFLVARASGRAMKPHGYGKIVMLSGGGATGPFPRYTSYACSKAGVVRLVETIAIELGEFGIDVNALAPGFVATRIHEATLKAGDRAGPEYLARTKKELAGGGVPPTLAAAAALFLLSSASDRIRGRLLAAPWDDWQSWPDHRAEIVASDLFTLRRIVPRDRGIEW